MTHNSIYFIIKQWKLRFGFLLLKPANTRTLTHGPIPQGHFCYINIELMQKGITIRGFIIENQHHQYYQLFFFRMMLPPLHFWNVVFTSIDSHYAKLWPIERTVFAFPCMGYNYFLPYHHHFVLET